MIEIALAPCRLLLEDFWPPDYRLTIIFRRDYASNGPYPRGENWVVANHPPETWEIIARAIERGPRD